MPPVSGRPARSYPLRTLLLWLVVGLGVPTLVLAGIVVQRVSADSRATAERRLLEEARELSRVVDDDLLATVRALTALAESPSLTTGDLAAFRREAVRYLPSQPSWHAVLLTSPDGRNIINTHRPTDETLEMAVETGSFEQTLETVQPAIGRLRPDVGGQLGFPVRVPVVRANVVRYVLSAVITPERLAHRLEFRSDDDWLRTVLDADFTIVARSRSPETFIGRQPSASFVGAITGGNDFVFDSITLDGEAVYSGVSRGAYTGWRAVVAVPRVVVDADYRRTMTLLGSIGVLLIGLGGVASLKIARRIARDMSMATEAAAALAAGRTVVVDRPRTDEVRQLADALTRSAELLRTREAERDTRLRQADAARAEAEAANRAKDEFLAMLGHELRNPLAPVLNALHVAERSGGVLGAHERRIVERQLRHMTRLVDDLLDMSRLHRGAIDLHIESCDLRDIVSAAVEMTRGLYDQQQQVLTVDVPDALLLECDAHRVTQVVANLLTNAAKYSEPGARVRLVARTEDHEVVITCEDNGVGIASDLLERVFEPFVQGRRTIDRRQGGLGLGLAVARGLVEQHGGRMTAASEGEGKGSRFEVRLPATSPRHMAAAAPVIERSASTQRRVLIVEDSSDVREMLVLALSMSGVEARGVGSGRDAVDAVASWRPDIAVLDIGLPDMDGYQLARTLRAGPDGGTLLLVALTGYGGDTHANEARVAGFDTFLVKPVGIDVLLDVIAKLER